MGSLFTLLSNLDKTIVSLIIVGITLAISLIFTFLVSLKMRGSKSFFITSALMPMVVAMVISMVAIFLDDTASGAVRIATIAVASFRWHCRWLNCWLRLCGHFRDIRLCGRFVIFTSFPSPLVRRKALQR